MISNVIFPKHWEVVPLDEVVFYQEGPGVQKHQYTSSGVKLINVGNLKEGILDLTTTFRFISEEEAYGRYKHFLVDEGDLLIASSGITVDSLEKKIAFVGSTHLPLCMNTSTIRFKPIDTRKLDINYFRYYLATWLFKGQVKRLVTGSAQLNYGPSHLRQMKVPLPPLPEQERIAAILEKADAIRRKREGGIRLTEELLRSTFLEMFGEPAKQSKWHNKLLGDFVDVASGQVDPKEEPYSSMQHVGGDNITSHTGEINGTATAEELGLISGKYEFTPLDVLYSKIRPALNKVACPDFEGICSADIYPIRPRPGEVSREFLACLLRSDDFLAYATKHSSRTNIPKINRPALLAFQMRLPPYCEQLRFDAIAKRIREMKHHRLTASKEADSCFNALVQRGFRGEL